MSCPFNAEQLMQLKAFVELCKNQPLILQHPKLSFFKDYLVFLGVNLPSATFGAKSFTPAGDGNVGENVPDEPSSESEDSMAESDVELDMEGVIVDDSCDTSQEMGDETKEPTDEERDLSDEKRSEAMRAFSEQNYEEAIKLYTEAIKLNPQSALLFAKRGQVFLKQKKLYACIEDCSYALKLNCDSAAAFKFRGRSYRLLGKFEEASRDLCESLKIDYDEQTNEWLNEVKPNAEKLRQHKLSVQRKREEKEHRDKIHRARQAQEARAKAAREHEAKANVPPGMSFFADILGGKPGMGGAPGDERKFDVDKLVEIMSDPDVRTAIEDPEIIGAFYDVSSNPANISKYQNNPKVTAALEMLQKKYKNYAGGKSTPGSEGPKSYDDDVGLD